MLDYNASLVGHFLMAGKADWKTVTTCPDNDDDDRDFGVEDASDIESDHDCDADGPADAMLLKHKSFGTGASNEKTVPVSSSSSACNPGNLKPNA